MMRKQMKIGDKMSIAGIAAVAEVSKEAHPDYTAEDPTHPYYDPKSASRSAESEPTWWMVELTFDARLKHFVPLSVLRQISACANIGEITQLGSSSEGDQPSFTYLTAKDLAALKEMPLLNRGRLSVQPVNPGAWDAINKMGEKGWSDTGVSKRSKKSGDASKSSDQTNPRKRKNPDSNQNEPVVVQEETDASIQDVPKQEPRRSKRSRR
ncbi:hypothetical protein FRC12_010778 [Ceratobasidium sp. 428]|nr:hypothetical protein FRC12_010778 [Ceratobasidium sp. 428]